MCNSDVGNKATSLSLFVACSFSIPSFSSSIPLSLKQGHRVMNMQVCSSIFTHQSRRRKQQILSVEVCVRACVCDFLSKRRCECQASNIDKGFHSTLDHKDKALRWIFYKAEPCRHDKDKHQCPEVDFGLKMASGPTGPENLILIVIYYGDYFIQSLTFLIKGR